MTLPSDEQVEASRRALDIPDGWEYFSCAAGCGDIVWCPPGVGDMGVRVVCSGDCAQGIIARFAEMNEDEQNLGELD